MSTQTGAQKQQQQQTQNTNRVSEGSPPMLLTQGTACDNCLSTVRGFIHNIRQRGTFSRFCTSCVLTLNATCFCSLCYRVFDPLHPPQDRISCMRCPSSVHHDCVKHKKEQAALYMCPLCTNPRVAYFVPDMAHSGIDLRSAKLLRAAAQIANNSMKKAVEEVKSIFEWWTVESVSSRNRTKKALDYLVSLQERENGRGTADLVAPAPVAAHNNQIKADGNSGSSARKGKMVVEDIPENNVPRLGVNRSSVQIGPVVNGRRTYSVKGKGKKCAAASSKQS